jgi:threonine-phosphate decarboxylase
MTATSTSESMAPVHGGQMRQIAARYGIAAERLLDFSANINPDGPPAVVLAAIRRALEVPETLTAYPDLELSGLRLAISKHEGVLPQSVAVANGFVPLLEAALRSLKTVRCLLPVPAFGEYRKTLESCGVAVVPYRLLSDESFRYRPEDLLRALRSERCDSLLLANPQNPSGALCSKEAMQRLIEAATGSGVTVLLDEAFMDYSPVESLAQFAAERANVIVFRSVTKFFAIPGLRVAYAIRGSSVVEGMNRVIAPWPVTTLASEAVCAALGDEVYAEEARGANERRRLWLEEQLARLGIASYPSSANFLLLRFPAEFDVDLAWTRMIVGEQIVLRLCTNFEGLPAGHLRIAVRSEMENERLIRGLERVLRTAD